MRFHFSRSQVLSTLNTFTVSFLAALAITALAIRANHDTMLTDQVWFSQTLITIAIFIPWMVIAEWRTSLTGRTNLRLLGTFKVIVLGLLYYLFWVPDMHTAIMQDGYVLQIGLHAFITWGSLIRMIPVLMKREAKTTWMHTYLLFIQSIITIIFCGVLFAGLAAAMKAIDYLFGINIPSERFFDLRAIVAGVFGSFFWLSRLSPKAITYFYTEDSFPKVLRVFAEYILGFLLVVYAVILIAYTIKISVSGVWPSGMVAGLTFGFLAMGTIYCTILLPRIIDGTGSRIQTRILGLLFVGAAILLRAALQQRVEQYGRTVERVMIILISLRTLAIAASFLIARPSLSYRLISGTIIGILGYYVPTINIFTFAQNDQVARLTSELQKVQFSMTTKKADGTLITDDTNYKVSDRVQYLLRYHGTQALEPFTTPELLSTDANTLSGKLDTVYYRSIAERVVTSRGFTYMPYTYYQDENGNTVTYFSYNGTYPRSITIEGYKDMAFIHSFQDPENIKQEQAVGTTSLNATPTSPIYKINLQDRSLSIRGSNPQTISLDPFIREAISNTINSNSILGPKEAPLMGLDAYLLTGDTYAIYLLNINGTIEKQGDKDVTIINNFEGILLLR